MKDNIFEYPGERGELMEIFYRLLMSGKIVSYRDVLKEYDREDSLDPSDKITAHPSYSTLKHVVPELIDKLATNGYTVLPITQGRETCYQYVGSTPDPLRNIKFKAKITERCKLFSLCIKNKQPTVITYKPFDKNKMNIVFHPHLLYTYNGRHFVFGVSEKKGKEPFRRFCIALDRIEGEIRIAGSDTVYITALKNEYSYLSQLVGVRLEEGSELTTIRIRVFGVYTFGRITTKPLHDTQQIITAPDSISGKDFGDIEITVYPNSELMGQILSYGSNIQILSPESLRQKVNSELIKMKLLYSG